MCSAIIILLLNPPRRCVLSLALITIVNVRAFLDTGLDSTNGERTTPRPSHDILTGELWLYRTQQPRGLNVYDVHTGVSALRIRISPDLPTTPARRRLCVFRDTNTTATLPEIYTVELVTVAHPRKVSKPGVANIQRMGKDPQVPWIGIDGPIVSQLPNLAAEL